MEPAAAERLGRLGGLVPVLPHHGRPAVDDLADLAGRHVVHLVVHDAYLDVDHRRADRADLADRVLAAQRARHRAALGLAERRHDLGLRERVDHRAEQRRRRGRRAPRDPAQRGQVAVADVRDARTIAAHWAGTKKHDVTRSRSSSASVAAGSNPPDVAMIVRPPVIRPGIMPAIPAMWNSGAPDSQHLSSAVMPEVRDLGERVQQQVAVGEHGALGTAGGAGGVHDERGVLVRDGGLVVHRRTRSASRVLERVPPRRRW